MGDAIEGARRCNPDAGSGKAHGVRARSSKLLVAIISLVGACDTERPPAPEVVADGGGGPAIGVPPLLDAVYHPGWTNPMCGDCHVLPVDGHTTSERYVCAQCHGANGACLPNGYNDEKNDHLPTDDCGSCHVDGETQRPGNHGFTQSDVCANCHFRELGQRPCEDYEPPPLPEPSDTGTPVPTGEPPVLSDALVTDCFGFPGMPFGPGNGVPKDETWVSILQPGDLAVDFTLPDIDGQPHTLSELLADGPVWLQLGNYTCPVYQSAVRDGLNALVAAEGPLGPYAELVQFVHVYNVEAHPAPPDLGPYGDATHEYSTVGQPTTMQARVANATLMEPIVEGELMLVDGLGEPWGNDPVFCTYAHCPTCSYLIGRDGRIHEVLPRTSSDLEDLVAPLDAFLATQDP